MEHANNTQPEYNSVESKENSVAAAISVGLSEISTLDPQVKAGGSPKRKFTAHYKQQILNAYNACSNAEDRGALLRREGLYSSSITSWRKLFSSENDTNKGANKSQRNEHLVVEIEGLKKKLAQAQAIIDLQKKVSELLGTYILPHESKGGRS